MARVTAPLFRTTLERHPCESGSSIASVRVEVSSAGEGLRVAFEFCGAPEALALPTAPLDPAKLWEHTCAELFLAREDGGYVEWNFSPTGQVARFGFSAYRARVSTSFEEDLTTLVRRRAESVQLEASGPMLHGIGRIASASLCAVVRAPSGTCSYWALAHPKEEPDFHDRRGFILDARALRR
jgi:hypothetical protein